MDVRKYVLTHIYIFAIHVGCDDVYDLFERPSRCRDQSFQVWRRQAQLWFQYLALTISSFRKNCQCQIVGPLLTTFL